MLEIPHRKVVLSKKHSLVAAFIVIISIALLFITLVDHQTSTMATSVNMGTVRTGNVSQEVFAYGRLATQTQTQTIALVEGIIEQVLVFPGSRINKGDLLFTLINPELLRDKEQAAFDLIKAEVEHESALADLLSDKVRLENAVELAQINTRMNELELEKLRKLLKNHVVSEIDFLRAENGYDKSQLELKLAIKNKDIFNQLGKAKRRSIEINLITAKRQLKLTEQDIKQLNVTASSSGLLSQLEEATKPGIPVVRGQKLAVITDPASFYAELLVTATDANKLEPGQSAIIIIGKDKIPATLIRIYPTVESNQIQVHVVPLQSLPMSAKENLDISAQILVTKSANTKIVERPAYVSQGFKKHRLYVLDKGVYKARDVSVGMVGTTTIEVIEGLSVKDKILLSVPEDLIGQDIIELSEING